MKFNILLVDDEENQRIPIKGFLTKKGYNVIMASSYTEAIMQYKENLIDLVITDYKLKDKTGLDVLIDIKKHNPITPIIVMTAFATIDDAVNLMKQGAYDYLQKPIDLEELIITIEKAKELINLKNENTYLKEQLSSKFKFDSIISQSGEMDSVLSIAARVAESKASVLIRGESGTGKELIAKAVHFASNRKEMPFITVNCAAMPDTLFESELFGHEKGAFTGADKQRIGKFELANGGTLFIDEVGDIPPSIQVKLLRAIQFGQIERLGGNKTIDLDVRIISATNRNLEEMIKKNEFREDLFYRFNVVQIQIPPLRKRKTDIPLLISHFIDKYASFNGKNIKGISKDALNLLMKYDFPGNVRELENIIQRAVVLSRTKLISIEDLPNQILNPVSTDMSNNVFSKIEIGDLNKNVEALEKHLIEKALEKTDGNQVKAAELLNISERTLRYKLSKIRDGEHL